MKGQTNYYCEGKKEEVSRLTEGGDDICYSRNQVPVSVVSRQARGAETYT